MHDNTCIEIVREQEQKKMHTLSHEMKKKYIERTLISKKVAKKHSKRRLMNTLNTRAQQ